MAGLARGIVATAPVGSSIRNDKSRNNATVACRDTKAWALKNLSGFHHARDSCGEEHFFSFVFVEAKVSGGLEDGVTMLSSSYGCSLARIHLPS